jgi:hypothetical protein
MTRCADERALFSSTGLTPSAYSSGASIRKGHISRQARVAYAMGLSKRPGGGCPAILPSKRYLTGLWRPGGSSAPLWRLQAGGLGGYAPVFVTRLYMLWAPLARYPSTAGPRHGQRGHRGQAPRPRRPWRQSARSERKASVRKRSPEIEACSYRYEPCGTCNFVSLLVPSRPSARAKV